MFENRALRRIFDPTKDRVTRKWRRLHNEELYDLCSSPNIIQLIKSKRMRWAGHVACRDTGVVHTWFWWGNLGEETTWKT